MLKTIVINENNILLNTLENILHTCQDYTLVGAFTDPNAAMQAIRVLSPDVIFINLAMTKMDGVEFTKALSPDKYILVATNEDTTYAFDAIKLGVSDYLVEPISAEQIVELTPKLEKKQNMMNLYNSTCAPHGHVVQCFGSFSVITPEHELIKWPTRKVEELFAYCLVHFNQVINKWRLAEDLWPNKGLHNIYNAVYLCNKVLKEHNYPLQIERFNDGYRLQVVGDVMIDLISFDALQVNHLHQPQTVGLMDHVSKAGALFEDKDYPWATMYREQLALKHQHFLEVMLNHYRTEDSATFDHLMADYARLYDV